MWARDSAEVFLLSRSEVSVFPKGSVLACHANPDVDGGHLRSGLIITSLTFSLPFAIWMLASYFDGTLRELDEAATNVFWNQIMAASLVVSVSVVVAFLLLQRNFVEGLTAGAVQ